MYARRLGKELNSFDTAPEGIKLIKADDLKTWIVEIKVNDSEHPIYGGHFYTLKFIFSNSYPIEAPIVTFITTETTSIPMHPHIYSNGHICLDLLGDGWAPVQSVQSIALSIQSMLAGNYKNERPPDDSLYSATASANPKNSKFYYHDDV